MKCIQCDRSQKECTILRTFQSLRDERDAKAIKTFLCRDCATCNTCRRVSINRPSNRLYKQNVMRFGYFSKQIGFYNQMIEVCMSLPWECLMCTPCEICGDYDRFRIGNCHATCFHIWCIWQLGNSNISHFPKDLIILILRTLSISKKT